MKRPLIDRRDFLKAAGTDFVASLAPRGAGARRSTPTPSSPPPTSSATAPMAWRSCRKPARSCTRSTCPTAATTSPSIRCPAARSSSRASPAPSPWSSTTTGSGAPLTIASVAGRHFFGHGVFSPDGALLYATENDFENAAGMIGIYDARANFERIGEFPTHGVGPHELLLLDDGRTIAIANGGIETHPDFGRAKLNIPTMKPSFVLRRPRRPAS